jgi:hypothetical protein
MHKLFLELTWWLITALIVGAVIYPIWPYLDGFPVLSDNIMFVVVFITLTRYIFLLENTFLARLKYLKVLFVLVATPFIFFLVEQHQAFQTNLDNIGPEYITKGVEDAKVLQMASYIKSEFTLFAVGSIVAAAVFPLRMIVSVWRQINKGTV